MEEDNLNQTTPSQQQKSQNTFLKKSLFKKAVFWMILFALLIASIGAYVIYQKLSILEPNQNIADEDQKQGQLATRCEGNGRLQKDQFGASTDELGDANPSYLDITSVELLSTEGKDNIELVLSTGGIFPTTNQVKASYRFLFNSDNNKVTGKLIKGFSGIEKEFRIDVTGDQSVGPLSVSGTIIDKLSGKESSLPVKLNHVSPSDLPSYGPGLEQFQTSIPKDLLGLTADEVPVGIVSQSTVDIVDTTSLIFDQKASEKLATLHLSSAFSNQPVNFTIKGLTPNENFNIKIEDEVVLSANIGQDGNFSGSFILPTLAPGEYFVTAQDNTGNFAFNVIECVL